MAWPTIHDNNMANANIEIQKGKLFCGFVCEPTFTNIWVDSVSCSVEGAGVEGRWAENEVWKRLED